MEQKVKAGDVVKVNYIGRFEDGETFDSSVGSDPLEFTVGNSEVIKGFDDAVIGMRCGESVDVVIPPEDAYGVHDENLVIEMPKQYFPEDIDPEIGMRLQLVDDDNNEVMVVVKEIAEDVVKLDANHPLAGKSLCFEIELVSIG